MNNLIPYYIYEQIKNKRNHGEFNGHSLFMDVSGFTAITEQLMHYGKEGAEILSSLMNDLFNQLVETVYQHDGFITTFAGDAFTAIFQAELSSDHVLDAACTMTEITKTSARQKTRFGDFEISIKIGISSGLIEWGIVGPEYHKSYFFRGPTVSGCACCQQLCEPNQIIFDTSFKNLLSPESYSYEVIDENRFLLKHYAHKAIPTISKKDMNVTDEVTQQFLPEKILLMSDVGEFRNVISQFIAIDEKISFRNLDMFMTRMIKIIDTYGGFLEILDFGDKGANILIIFGIPQTYENIFERGVQCIMALSEEFGDAIRGGMTWGNVFAGIRGGKQRASYGVIGDSVNLSARLMMQSRYGEILVSEDFYNNSAEKELFKSKGQYSFKGIKRSIPVYLLSKASVKTKKFRFHHELIGREDELTELDSFIKRIAETKSPGCFVILGTAGVGKSHFIDEFCNQKQNSYETLKLYCDSILQKTLNPFQSFLNDYFNQMLNLKPEEKKHNFDLVYERIVRCIDAQPVDNPKESILDELNRIKSILASVLGITWPNSIFEKISDKEKPQVIRRSLAYFFRTLALINPLLLIFEDIQWIDSESALVIEEIINIKQQHTIVICTSRLNDDGSEPGLLLTEKIITEKMLLKEFQEKELKTFLETMASGPVDHSIISYIQSKTSGNPFFSEQFFTYLKNMDCLDKAKGQYRLTKEPDDLPSDISTVITSRIDRLSIELKEAVQIASVLGNEFSPIVVTRLFILFNRLQKKHPSGNEDNNEKDMTRILHEGEQERIWSRLDQTRFVFHNALLRDVAYTIQLKKRLRKIHFEAAHTIEELFSEDSDSFADIAYHYHRAEHNQAASTWYEKAGDHAYNIFRIHDAITYYKNSLTLTEKSVNNELLKGILYRKIGNAYEFRADYEEALHYKKQAENLFSKPAIESQKELAITSHSIGNVYLFRDQYKCALDCYMKSLSINKEIFGDNDPSIISTCSNIGTIYCDLAEFDDAISWFKKALRIIKKIPKLERRRLGGILNNLGIIYDRLGNYKKSRAYFTGAVEVNRLYYGSEHPEVAVSLNNLGLVYRKLEEYESSEECHRSSLAIYHKIFGEQHPRIATSYNNLGIVYLYQHNYDLAEEYFQQSLDLFLIFLGSQSLPVAFIYNNLGTISEKKGDFKKALYFYDKNLKIIQNILGQESLDLTDTFYHIGLANFALGEYDQAIKHMKHALDIYEKKSMDTHPDYLGIFRDLGIIYRESGHNTLALNIFEQGVRKAEESRNQNERCKFLILLLQSFVQKNNERNINIVLDEILHINGKFIDRARFFLVIALMVSNKIITKKQISFLMRRLFPDYIGSVQPIDLFQEAITSSISSNDHFLEVEAQVELVQYLFKSGDELQAREKLHQTISLVKTYGLRGRMKKLREEYYWD